MTICCLPNLESLHVKWNPVSCFYCFYIIILLCQEQMHQVLQLFYGDAFRWKSDASNGYWRSLCYSSLYTSERHTFLVPSTIKIFMPLNNCITCVHFLNASVFFFALFSYTKMEFALFLCHNLSCLYCLSFVPFNFVTFVLLQHTRFCKHSHNNRQFTGVTFTLGKKKFKNIVHFRKHKFGKVTKVTRIL